MNHQKRPGGLFIFLMLVLSIVFYAIWIGGGTKAKAAS